MEAYKKLFDNLPIFNSIDEADIMPMLHCLGANLKSYTKNQFIFRSSEAVPFVGVVLSGRLHLIKEFYHGKTSIYDILSYGDTFGNSFICSHTPTTSLSVKSATAAVVLCLPFAKLLQQCPANCVFHNKLITNMLRLTAQKNLTYLSKFEITSKKSIRERLFTYLIQLSHKQNSRQVEVPLSRTCLADYLDVDRSSLSREIKKLQEQQQLIVNKNKFTLLYHFHKK